MKPRWVLAVCILGSAFLAARCTTTVPKPHRETKTSIIQFLNLDEKAPVGSQKTAEPTLTVPLKGGITFVLSRDYEGFPERERMRLMQDIASQFEKYTFVESIELIPSLYMEEKRGFLNLDRLRQLFGIDVIMKN